jgi:DNA segregation ATPase FtsK/SpoIIIE, S-DNA-T family
MPKKAKKNTKTHFFRDERFKITMGLVFLAFSAILTLAFVSYFFTWKTDQSFEWSKPISGADVRVENWSGKAGAYFANLFINKHFGIASFALPFLLFIIGFRLFNIRLMPLRKTIRNTLLLTLLFSVALGYIFGIFNGYMGSGLGGTYGFVIAEWLNAFLGHTGTFFLLFVILISFLLFTFPSIPDWARKTFAFPLKTLGRNEDTDIAFDEGKGHGKNSETKAPANDDDIVFETEYYHVTEDVRDQPSANNDNGHDLLEMETVSNQKLKNDNEIGQKPSNAEDDVQISVENHGLKEDTVKKNLADLGEYDPTMDLSSYKVPPLELLDEHKSGNLSVSNEELINNKNKIVETLNHYKIQIDKIKATIGPTVTLYEIVPAPGIRISKIKNLEDDIALSLAALGIRIIAPMPGKGTIGIEVPNQNPEIVSMRSILSSRKFQESKHDLCIALGKTISNETYTFDLTKMPHLLVAGATGQGKSVGLNAIITSLLYKKHPSQIKFVMIDPKKVELNLYSSLERHFLAKLPGEDEAIITDTQKVIHTLNSLCMEMDDRYELLKRAQVRNLKEYNSKFIARKLNPENGHRFMPYIVVIIDEFADLIMTAGREVETPLGRLAQLARAIGIHLIIATQRPTTNIITGVIKANFPARIAFRVTSMIDSRTILDTPGANQLIGRGDMLISSGSDLIRLQCAFIDIPELEKITEYISSQRGYPTAMMLPEYVGEDAPSPGEVDLTKRDELFDDAARLVVSHQQGSTSLIQRKFSIGYNRAGRIVDQLEAAGVVGPFEGSKARSVLFPDEYSLEQYLSQFNQN